MRAILQRVREARVEVEGKIVGQIGPGLLVLLGIAKPDTTAQADFLLDKTLNLRIFPDDQHRMNRSLLDTNGDLLVVSQFTLYGDTRRGRRPSFDEAAPPEQAVTLYRYFVEQAKRRVSRVETGTFQALMDVYSINYGPVTLICDTPSTVRSVT